MHIQNQGRIYKKDQESLVEQYEHKISAIKTETERLKTDMSFFQERSARLEIVSTRQVEAENRVIFLERRKQEVEATLQADLKELRTSSAQLRQESMHLQIQLTQGKAELQQLQTQFKAVQNLCQETQIQRDELQNLWSESQKQSEENQLRLQSLQKINQELSRRVRDLRKANENQVIAPLTGMSSTDAPPKSAAVKADGPQAQMTGDAYARLDEIDSLLMGIQSGFAISRDREGEKIQKPELDPS